MQSTSRKDSSMTEHLVCVASQNSSTQLKLYLQCTMLHAHEPDAHTITSSLQNGDIFDSQYDYGMVL